MMLQRSLIDISTACNSARHYDPGRIGSSTASDPAPYNLAKRAPRSRGGETKSECRKSIPTVWQKILNRT